MGNNYDPDETAVLDINVAKRRIMDRLAADGVYDDQDAAVVMMLEEPVNLLSTRLRVRRNFDSIMRNGINRYTKTNATDAGIVFVEAGKVLDNVIPWPAANTKTRHRGGTHDDAA